MGVGGGFVGVWSLPFGLLFAGLLKLLVLGLMVRAVLVRGLCLWMWDVSVVGTALP